MTTSRWQIFGGVSSANSAFSANGLDDVNAAGPASPPRTYPSRRRALLLAALAPMLALAAPQALAELADVIPKVKASVVIVGLYKETNSPRFTLRGTGFVAGSGNTVVTNAHVLPDAADLDFESTLMVQVRDASGTFRTREAKVVDIDKNHDLAVLRIDGAPLPTLKIGASEAVKEGQAVAFMGFPLGGALGFSSVTHRGWISSISAIALPTAAASQLNERSIRAIREGTFNIFQLDATAYPGNSGGPMFDPETGDVLGVINMVFVKGARETALTNPSGISYAIPSSFVQQILQKAR